MKPRARPDRPAAPARGPRLSTAIIVIALLCIFFVSPDPPSIEEVRTFSKSVGAPSAKAGSVESKKEAAEPVRAENIEQEITPQKIAEEAEREARKEMKEEMERKGESAVAGGMDGGGREAMEQVREVEVQGVEEVKADKTEIDYMNKKMKEDREGLPVPKTEGERRVGEGGEGRGDDSGGDYAKNEITEGQEVSVKPAEVKPEVEMKKEQPDVKGEMVAEPEAAVERESENNGQAVSAIPVDGSKVACRTHIVYDKPVKTGSTAVTKALRKYLDARGAQYLECSFDKCTDAAKELCAGKREKVNFVEHMLGDEDAINCLGRNGFYKVTSIREPLERWESAFLYNRNKKATHYGIHYQASYEEFMSKYPACSLFDYYDGLGKRCEMSSLPLEQRIDRIVKRYDEVIDLYHDEVFGQLHKRLQDDLREENKSPRPEHDFRVPIDMSRLQNETRLYEALRKRQKELAGKEAPLC